ncbi:MAG: phospho-sugar mutase, partial [Ruminococcaceae bacterium]|nr:phospho-sugar mutase [Oscillospiraceae bacterium]
MRGVFTMIEINKTYQHWLSNGNEETVFELKSIANDENEMKERFYRNLEFGTGGLRGVIGAGTNRINIYTVRQATQALANYLIYQGEEKKGVCISYDSRKYSDVFAAETACVLAANGIKAYLSDTLRPVPFLSYSVLHFKAAAGVMITASHNPPKYNGYKAYCSTGEQIAPEMANEIMKYIMEIDVFSDVKTMNLKQAISEGMVVMVGKEVEDAYLTCVLQQQRNPEITKNNDLKIVYTPLHGSGNIPVRRALEMAGFSNVLVVPEQELPDPAFSTVKSPNPEEKEGFKLAMELADKEGADLIIGTDPDCDRVGALVRETDGGFRVLNGNQTGVILLDYILSNTKLPKNGAVIKTIVTTYMANAICKAYGVTVMDVLTGFKFIGEKIKEFEASKEYTYLFGFEESY